MLKNTIIPLGQNCMPRTILTRFKIKPSKLYGELSFPFDLAVFGMVEITKNLHNDFSEFFCNIEFNGKIWIKKNTADFKNNCIEFYHEKTFDNLVSIYKKRIQNFRIIINSSKPLIFFQITSDISEFENHYNEILRLCAHKTFKFLVVNTGNEKVKNIPQNACVLDLSYPSEIYKQQWWNKKYYKSSIGIDFEQKIADFCADNSNI